MAYLNNSGVQRLWAHIISKLNNKIDETDAATDDDIIDLMLEMDMMPVVQDADGAILVDSDNAIILI